MPESIEGVIDRSGEDRFALKRAPISLRVWTAAVGARIADRARPVSLERGVLIVKVATSVWANELSLLQESLIARLRNAGVEVKELRFRVGEIEPPARPPERRGSRVVPPPAPLPRELAVLLSRIEDKDLKEAIALAARANLAWQQNNDPPPREKPPDDAQRSAAKRSSPSRR
jgi:predicted nucleic acid-binding Zn ribbon protein